MGERLCNTYGRSVLWKVFKIGFLRFFAYITSAVLSFTIKSKAKLVLRFFFIYIGTSRCIIVKAVPLEAWSGPEGSRNLRFPGYMTTAQDDGKVVSLTHRPLFTPQQMLLVLISVRR